MGNEIHVYIDLNGIPILVGHLWIHSKQTRQSLSFEYDRAWLKMPNRFSLDPALQLTEGAFHASVDKPLFGAIEDSAPDRWGRLLLRRAERKLAAKEKRHPRTLTEIDFLLLINDETRQGSLRFKADQDSFFLTTYEQNSIPPLLSLGKLLSASNRISQDSETEEDLRLILAPGSSLGGARPKASIRDKDGHLAIAKFPKSDDEIDVIGWEAVALTLAAKAHIITPKWSLESLGKRRVLISRRFDRLKNIRIPFLSAMSALQAQDNEPHSYLEIADAIRQMSASPQNDLRALWRRMIFNILISNVDDHLRNHAFLYSNTAGWILSPAYDLNPTPTDIKPRVLSTAIDLIDSSASLDLAYNVGGYFDLTHTEMKQIAKEVAHSTSEWQIIAKKLKIAKSEIDRMASAFEHEDLKKAMC
jgi:serine/threonine-protein kinase HipA